ASTLANLNLPPGPMALSILGFNLGIELMQLFVVVLTMPWLLLLSQTTSYTAVRVAGASCAAMAALAWVAERSVAPDNAVAALVTRVAQHAPWLLAALVVVATLSYWRRSNQEAPNKASVGAQ
ncbi:HupE/UreJ family protein, partial [Microbispora triticiradicis]|uniref:HupE/UreJ family protein n=1 Tax=Microbispora triticiradicis TaxID=2200763 RepID=UPI001AD77514|nr:HupE/UreJ family protein [Microbispora triticiradicis]